MNGRKRKPPADTGAGLPPEDDAPDAVQDVAVLPPIPVYPVDALCGPLAELVTGSTLPAPMVAGAGLAALAGLCPNAEVEMLGSYQRAIVWIALLAPSGGAKSPSMELAFERLYKLDAARRASYLQEYSNWRATPQGQRGPKPPDHTRVVEDLTVEKLARLLQEDPARMMVHDELAKGLRNLGQYKVNSGDRDKFLELWTGGTKPWRYSRVGSTADGIDFMIDRPTVTLFGGLQIARLDALGSDDDGFRPRFLPHIWTAIDIEHADLRAPRAWTDTITALYQQADASRTWWMATDRTRDSSETLKLWLAAGRRWKATIHDEPKQLVRAALAKADIQCVRIALVLAESMDPGASGKIPAEAMQAATAIVDYSMDVWRALDDPATMAYTVKEEKIHKAVTAWHIRAEEKTDQRVDLRELHRGHVGGVRNAAQLADVLAEYEATYPGCVTSETKPKQGRATTWVHAPRRG